MSFCVIYHFKIMDNILFHVWITRIFHNSQPILSAYIHQTCSHILKWHLVPSKCLKRLLYDTHHHHTMASLSPTMSYVRSLFIFVCSVSLIQCHMAFRHMRCFSRCHGTFICICVPMSTSMKYASAHYVQLCSQVYSITYIMFLVTH